MIKKIGKKHYQILTLRSKKAFTLMEIMVSIAILSIVFSAVTIVFTSLIYDGKKNKAKIEMNAEIVDSIAVVKKYIKEGNELKILDSNILEKNILGDRLNGILIKNNDLGLVDKRSLFTLIKPLQKTLSGDFGEKTVGDKGFYLGITDLNLFSDIVKDGDDLYFTDPGNGYVWKKDSSGVLTKISGFDYNGEFLNFLTPVGLFVDSNNIFISDTYQNLIFILPKNNFLNSSVKILAGKIGEKVNKDTLEKTNYVVSGFKDGKLGRNTLNHPKGLAVHDNKLYFVDSGNNSIRFIDLQIDGKNVETFIGNGEAGISDDGDFHENFLLNNPSDIDIRNDIGMILISDTNNNRIVASGPVSGSNANSLPFTIAGVGKPEPGNLSDGFFNLDSEFVGTNFSDVEKEIINYEKNIGGSGFGGDFFIAKNAILNHPTGIKFFGKGGFVFSDSGNNLIRKVSVWNFIEGNSQDLFDNFNKIETIIGNASEVLISSKDDNGVMDIKTSVSAPKSKNKPGDSKDSFLDNPMGLSFSGSEILFTDLEINKKRLYGKINKCKNNGFNIGERCLDGEGKVEFIKNKAFNALNIDKISITNLGDFISKTPLDVMQFVEKNIDNSNQKIISIYLKFIDFLKKDDDIFIDIKTSVKNRNI